MTTNSEALNPEDLQERIIAKAIEDPAYKQRLLSDAKAVLEEDLGIELPADLSVQVLQQSPKQLYLVLPIDIDELVRDGIISQAELEAVAGGVISAASKFIATTAAQVSIFTALDYAFRKTVNKLKKK